MTRPRIRSSNEAVPGAESGSSIYSGATAEIDASLRDLTSVTREGRRGSEERHRVRDSSMAYRTILLGREKEDNYATRPQEATGILALRE